MKFSFIFTFITLIGLNTTWAGLYTCSESSERPTFVSADPSIELTYETTDPFLLPYHLNDEHHKNKTPFLIYYAIDSSEAFMQYSVKFEVAKLQESCLKSQNVNFAALLNSLYIEKNQIIICKNQKLEYLNLDKNPTLNNLLISKRDFIANGEHAESDDLGPNRYLVRYFVHSNKPFGKFPLAHPDFMFDLINFITTDKDLFPSKDYIPYINLKSHGSEEMVLAGMHECQEKAKELSANLIVKNILSEKEIIFLNNAHLNSNIISKIDEYDKTISKLHLGTLQGMNVNQDNDLGDNRLGDNRLSFHKNGLGNIVQGLGVSQGLGIEFSFGTAHITLNWVLGDLFHNDSDRVLGFLMLESCDTNRDPKFFHSYLNNVLGFYSAKSSLWYRNLNWWTILEKAQNSSINLMNILKEETSKIPNIKTTQRP